MAILKWQQSIFKGCQEYIISIRKKLEFILAQPLNEEDIIERAGLMQQLDQLLWLEETYWRQISHVLWMKDGDRNAQFFHQKQRVMPEMNERPDRSSSEEEIKVVAFQMQSSKTSGPDGMTFFFYQ
ncbi:hypothetical protein ACFX1X_023030 [Malus domestica]